MGKHFFSKIAWSNIRKNGQIYIPYIISCIGTIAMFYIMCALPPSIKNSNVYGEDTLISTLNLGLGVIGFFSVIFIFYTNSFIIKRRKKELGLYNILGLEKKHIAYIYTLETVFSSLISLLGGLVFGIIFSKIMFMILGKLLQTAGSIKFHVPLSSVMLSAVLFSAIFILILIYNLIQIYRSKPIELLNSEKTGEKEPKVNWVIAVIGIITLGGGYAISVSIKNPIDALLYFFFAVILVIVGTYCLFTAGMTALLKLLKRNKSYYYNPKHFTTVSGMIYRMKQNASGLATICILSTFILVMISTTFSMYTNMEDLLRTRFPRQFSIQARDVSYEDTFAIKSMVYDFVISEGYEPVDASAFYSSSFPIEKNENVISARPPETIGTPDDVNIAFIMTTEQFKDIYSGNLQPTENHVFCFTIDGSYPNDEVNLFGKTYSVSPFPADAAKNLFTQDFYENTYIVVPDESTFQELIDNAALQNDGNIMKMMDYSFDITGDEESQKALSAKLFEMLNNTDYTIYAESRADHRETFLSLYGGMFFLGIFLGVTFIMALVLIIYYKQISEGFEDRERYIIMQKVGMSRDEVKRSIRSQILLVFFIPLVMAVIHLTFAMPMLIKILAMLNFINKTAIFVSTGIIILLFTLIYIFVYTRTAKTYYKIVEN